MRRVLSLSLALTLLLEASAPAQVVRAVVPAAGTGAVPAVPPAAAAPSLGALSGPSLALSPALALPALNTPSVSQASQAALRLPAPALQPAAAAASAPAAQPAQERTTQKASPLRRMLGTAAAALAQNPAAQKLFPSLGRLGAALDAPKQDASSETQNAQAGALFHKKAFGSVQDDSGSAEAVEAEASRTPSRESLAPVFPGRRIRFNGKDFPSVVSRPYADLEPLLAKAIDAAQSSVVIAMHEFRMHEVLRALRRARERGVEVHIVVDHSALYPVREGYKEGVVFPGRRDVQLQILLNEGFDVTVLNGLWLYGLQHNRFAVVDGKFAAMGSARWVADADVNDHDSAQFTDEEGRVEALERYWKYLRSLSQPLATARDHAWPKDAPAPPADPAMGVRFHDVDLPSWVFSPGGAAEDAIVKVIDASKKTLDLAMFTFRSTRIAEALLRAHQRGVKVRAVFDRNQAGRDHMKAYADWLAIHNIPVKLALGPNTGAKSTGRMSHQFLVADEELLLTGSMNWTKNAFAMSFENLQLLQDEKDVAAFSALFASLFRSRDAERLLPPDAKPVLPTDSELVQELQKPRPTLPKLPAFPALPAVPEVDFNGTRLPAAAVRPQTPLAPLLVKAIDAAQKSLSLALYEFNLTEVLDALRRAKARGVDVRIILDYSHVFPQGRNGANAPKRKPEIQALIDEGFEVTVLKGFGKMGIMHNKFMVADGKLAEFGSFNWSDTAEFNHFENMNFSADPARVELYQRYWDWMRKLSQPVDEAEDFEWSTLDPGPPPADPDQPIDLNGQSFPHAMFSPDGAIAQTLIRAIDAAKSTLEIAMFTFYSQELADALLRAKERGVNVRIVLDASQAKNMKLDEWFAYHDFDVRLLAGPDPHGTWMFEKMHNKFLIADGKLLETGSYNYTGNADENNYENVNFIADAAVLAFFTAYFQMLHDLGWKPPKPKEPPASTGPGSEFFETARGRF